MLVIYGGNFTYINDKLSATVIYPSNSGFNIFNLDCSRISPHSTKFFTIRYEISKMITSGILLEV